MLINIPTTEAKLLFEILSYLKPSETKQVWLVGGSIRDLLRGKESCFDLDLTLSFNPFKSAKTYSLESASGFVVLDDARHIVRVVKKLENGKSYTFDLSQFRADDIDGDLKAITSKQVIKSVANAIADEIYNASSLSIPKPLAAV